MYGLWGRERGARADVPNHSPRAQSPGISTSKEQAAREAHSTSQTPSSVTFSEKVYFYYFYCYC